MATEQDLRLSLLNTLLTTPHRALNLIWPVHQELQQKDPRFYVRLAAWYNDHGDVRDHKEMFTVTLILSPDPEDREVGLAMMREMPPYQVGRIVDFINGRKEKVKVRVPAAAKVRVPKRLRHKLHEPSKVETMVDSIGLFRNPPRALRTEVTRYLREREADPDWFDSVVIGSRKVLKRLYALLHIKPSERAQAILFDEKPPADSKIAGLKQLAQSTDPEEQADLIRKLRLPYRIASTIVSGMTPPVVTALVERMSPQELLNSLASLKRRGALEFPGVQALVDEKLEAAQSSNRVSGLKTAVAIEAAGLTGEMREKLEQVADAQMKAKGRITRPTALLIDKSGSMEVAIELGKRIGAMISTICADKLYVYAFDTIAYPISPGAADLASWEKALRGITAGGGTSCGVAIDWMRRQKQYVEQIIMVSDQEENHPPMFVEELQKYRVELKADPNVCFVRVPNCGTQLEANCRAAGLYYDSYHFQGDYYSLPNLIPMLARPSKRELLMEILGYPLPQRKPA